MKLLTAFISKLMYACALVVLLAVGAFFALPHVPGFGALDVKIVKSGSMEPHINTGGVVVIHETPSYTIGDVVTFESVTADIPTTHRIIGTEVGPDGNTYFVTKGDANEDRDADLVAPESIIGKVVGDAPYVGFLLDFARQPVGFALLIGLPALLIIIDEVEKIWKALRTRRRTEDEGDVQDAGVALSQKAAQPQTAHMPLVVPPLPAPRRVMMHDIIPRSTRGGEVRKEEFAFETYAKRSSRLATSAFSVLVLGVTLFSSTYFVGGTVSYARDVEASLMNILKTTVADFTLDADITNFAIVDGVLTDSDVVFTILPTSSSEPLAYRTFVEFYEGDETLCGAILATSEEPLSYNGQLQTLGSADVSDAPGFTFDLPWTVGLALDGEVVSELGTTCSVRVHVVGWLEGRTEITSKYIDDEFLILTFTVEAPIPFAREAETVSLENLSIMLTEEEGTAESTASDPESGGGSPEEEGSEEEVTEEVVEENTVGESPESIGEVISDEAVEEEVSPEATEEESVPEPEEEPEAEVVSEATE